MYVYSNTEARSCYHCCSGKVISITYSECVFVALGIQHEMCAPYFISCIVEPDMTCPVLKYFVYIIS